MYQFPAWRILRCRMQYGLEDLQQISTPEIVNYVHDPILVNQ